MPLLIHQVDAFTDQPFRGNPAGVCLLDQPAPDSWMQAVGNEMNLAETSFLVPEGEPGTFRLRWFTPILEVDLCGHATLASAHVLWESGRLARSESARFVTRSGVLTATRDADGLITLDFPADPSTSRPDLTEPVAAALGLEPGALVSVAQGRFDVLVEVGDAATVRSIRPDFNRLGAIEARGVIVTSAADGETPANADFTSRFFAPRCGVPEDPVTGSAHCTLAGHWAARLGLETMVGYQASSRGGVVRVTVRGDRILLGGQAVTVFVAELAAGAGPERSVPDGSRS